MNLKSSAQPIPMANAQACHPPGESFHGEAKPALKKRKRPLCERPEALIFVLDIEPPQAEMRDDAEALLPGPPSNASIRLLMLSDTHHDLRQAGTQLPVSKHLQDRLEELLREIVVDLQHPIRFPARPLGVMPSPSASTMRPLTWRQLEIVEMIRNGKSNKEIARTLGLSLGTVKLHLHRIFRTLDVSNRVQLAMHPGAADSERPPRGQSPRRKAARLS